MDGLFADVYEARIKGGRSSIAPGKLLRAVLQSADENSWLSGKHFCLDGTLIQVWADRKSLGRKDGSEDGCAEREAAKAMVHDARQALPDAQTAVTLGADKSHNAQAFIEVCLAMNVIPHVAPNTSGRRLAGSKQWARFAR